MAKYVLAVEFLVWTPLSLSIIIFMPSVDRLDTSELEVDERQLAARVICLLVQFFSANR